mmetsp:Transcript_105273/g.293163  ORF Transcript_105273/g.293163 Transcript_105273/m.293163 type:complete len:105 (-) Transcript_105273:45-359(-)
MGCAVAALALACCAAWAKADKTTCAAPGGPRNLDPQQEPVRCNPGAAAVCEMLVSALVLTVVGTSLSKDRRRRAASPTTTPASMPTPPRSKHGTDGRQPAEGKR